MKRPLVGACQRLQEVGSRRVPSEGHSTLPGFAADLDVARHGIDLVAAGRVAIEVKGAGRVGLRDLRGLDALSEETQLTRQIVVCDEAGARKIEGVDIMPYEDFWRALWSDQIVSD